jgi:hypothetical protein
MISNDFPWSTFGVMVLTIVAALVGGAVVIWGNPGALTFNEYLDYMWKFAGAIGILGIGRGVKAGLENHGAVSSNLTDASLLTQIPGLLEALGGTAGNGGTAGAAAAQSGSGDVAIPVEITHA